MYDHFFHLELPTVQLVYWITQCTSLTLNHTVYSYYELPSEQLSLWIIQCTAFYLESPAAQLLPWISLRTAIILSYLVFSYYPELSDVQPLSWVTYRTAITLNYPVYNFLSWSTSAKLARISQSTAMILSYLVDSHYPQLRSVQLLTWVNPVFQLLTWITHCTFITLNYPTIQLLPWLPSVQL